MSNNLTESEFSSLVNRLAEPVARQVMRVVGDRERPTNTNRNVFQTAHEEMRNLFRFGGRGQGRGQAPARSRRGSSSRGTNQRYRPYTQQASAGKAIDVVLLLTPNESSTIRGQNRARLHEKGCIIDKFFFHKSWQSEEVTRRLQDAFADRLNDGSSMSFQILKPEGQTLVVPRLAQGEKMSGAKVCDIFAQKTMYLRPERRISVDTSDEEDNDMPDPFLGPSTSSSSPSLAHASSSSRSALRSTAPQRTSALTSSVSTAQCAPPTARACPQCTFLNSSNTDYCEICEATLSPSVSSDSQSVCQVLPSSGDDPSQQSRKLKNPASLIQDFISLIHFNNKPTNNLYIHRDELFNDNIAFFKNCRFDAKSGPIRVHFEGEEGIDAGGLIRENFCIFFQEVQSPEKNLVISTPTGKLLPSNNQFHTFSGMYQVLGKAIGTALLNEVSVEIPLHKAVIAVILKKTQEEIYAQLHKNDIIDLSLQDFITELLEETDEDMFQQLLSDESKPTHWLDSCGWPAAKAMKVENKHDIALCLMFHYTIGIRRDAIDAMQKGLLDCIPELHMVDLEAFADLLAIRPILAKDLKIMVQEALQKLDRPAESEGYRRTVSFISSFFTDLDDTDAHILAKFATGSPSFSPDQKLTIAVNTLRPEEVSPIANTCQCSIMFPQGHTTYASFKTTVLDRMAQTGDYFGRF